MSSTSGKNSLRHPESEIQGEMIHSVARFSALARVLARITHRADLVSDRAPDTAPADGAETESPAQATLKALTTALGSRSMILSNVLAAPVGTRCPCSHLRSVDALTPNASAN